MDFNGGPILVFWETPRACQLACRHCRASAIRDPLPGELSTEEGRDLVRSLRGFARPPVLILTGGDPLMRADLFDLAGFARRQGLPIGFAPSVTPLLTAEALGRVRGAGGKTDSIR